MISIRSIFALAAMLVKDGLKRNMLLALIILTLFVELSGLFFFQFVPRDIGRVSTDFVLSIAFISGMLFLFFHAVPALAWGEERRLIHTILSSPISRSEYVLAMFSGLFFLLLILNISLALLAWLILLLIKGAVSAYFEILSLPHYLFAWLGITGIQAMFLSFMVFFSGLVRGSFSLLIASLSYYLISSGLAVAYSFIEHKEGAYKFILKLLSLIFPDFSRFDFKSLVISFSKLPSLSYILLGLLYILLYLSVFLLLSSIIYDRRDLK